MEEPESHSQLVSFLFWTHFRLVCTCLLCCCEEVCSSHHCVKNVRVRVRTDKTSREKPWTKPLPIIWQLRNQHLHQSWAGVWGSLFFWNISSPEIKLFHFYLEIKHPTWVPENYLMFYESLIFFTGCKISPFTTKNRSKPWRDRTHQRLAHDFPTPLSLYTFRYTAPEVLWLSVLTSLLLQLCAVSNSVTS